MADLKIAGAALVVLVVTSPLVAQQRGATPAPASSSSKPTTPSFACPDRLAETACRSFSELLKAGDDAFYTGAYDVVYACFRPKEDSFFLFKLVGPDFRKTHYDTLLKKTVPDDDATSPGLGSIRGFVNGIEDTSSTPIGYVR